MPELSGLPLQLLLMWSVLFRWSLKQQVIADGLMCSLQAHQCTSKRHTHMASSQSVPWTTTMGDRCSASVDGPCDPAIYVVAGAALQPACHLSEGLGRLLSLMLL